RRRHTRLQGDWSSDVCSSDLWLWRGVILTAFSTIAVGSSDPQCGCVFVSPLPPSGIKVIRGKLTLPSPLPRVVFLGDVLELATRSEERRVGKECRCRWWGWEE